MTCLSYRELVVEQMPGVRGIKLQGLCEAVNVVLAPNAVGKSTLARAAQCLLWQKSPATGDCLRASLVVGQNTLEISLDSGKFDCRCVSGNLAYPVPEAQQWAYLLELKDLLVADDREIAAEVVRQVLGGLDIHGACEVLGFVEEPAKPRGMQKDIESADKLIQKATSEQAALEREESALGGLYKQLETCRRAQRLVALVECALELRAKMEEANNSAVRLSNCDPRAALAKGDELDRLGRLAREQDQLSDSESTLRKTLATLSERTDLELGEAQLAEVNDRLEALRQAEQQIEAAQTRLKSAGKQHAALASGAQIEADSENLSSILASARAVGKSRQQLEAASELNLWIGPVEPGDDPVVLKEALKYLNLWLQCSESGEITPFVAALSGLLMGIGATLAIFIGLGYGLIAATGFALLVWILVNRKSDKKAILEEQYLKLRLSSPEAWESQHVEQLLSETLERLGKSELESRKGQRWPDLPQKLATLEKEYSSHVQELKNLLEAAAIPFSDEYEIALVVESLLRQRSVALEIIALQSELDQARERLSVDIQRLQELLGRHVTDYISAKTAVEAYQSAIHQQSLAQEKLDQCTQNLGRIQKEIKSIYSAVQVESADSETLSKLLGMKKDYDLAYQQNVRARTAEEDCSARYRKLLESLSAICAQHGLSAEDLLTMTFSDLSSCRDDLNTQSADLEPVIARIKDIESKIAAVKQHHDVETLIAQRNSRRDLLRARRAESIDCVLGKLVADYVGVLDVEHVNSLLSCAREHFDQFTLGEYTLILDTAKSELSACRTRDNRSLSLDQLSSGTRAQLLIAARMAYIQSKEKTCTLPLLMDESLANSDDKRARQIAQALCAISKAGRQIIYFTAQADEVEKWKAAAELADCSFQCAQVIAF